MCLPIHQMVLKPMEQHHQEVALAVHHLHHQDRRLNKRLAHFSNRVKPDEMHGLVPRNKTVMYKVNQILKEMHTKTEGESIYSSLMRKDKRGRKKKPIE